MGERTTYTPGTFSWADLSTTDQDDAKRFYGELFGWKATDNPVGDSVVYSMMSIDGKDAAAISPQPEQQREAGAPPAWNCYITVDSADDALAKAKQLGANVHADAFDVMDVGRMGVVQDPQGAYFLVWEPKTHIGASIVNAPGAISWNELASPDPEASGAFYSQLFGWSTSVRRMPSSRPRRSKTWAARCSPARWRSVPARSRSRVTPRERCSRSSLGISTTSLYLRARRPRLSY